MADPFDPWEWIFGPSDEDDEDDSWYLVHDRTQAVVGYNQA